jgi:hypothetical protein
MPCRGRLAEFVLHITNLVYFCSGVAVLTVGAIGLSEPSTIVNMLSYVPAINTLSQVMYMSGIAYGPSVYLTVIGTLVIVLSFVGCGGAYRRSHHIIITFGLITLLMMLFNICVVMFYAIDPYYVQGSVQSSMMTILTNDFVPITFNSTNGTVLPTFNSNAMGWIQMQSEQSCCGVVGPSDYQSVNLTNSIIFSASSLAANIPPSCCLQITPNQTQIPTNAASYVDITACLSNMDPYMYANTQGCLDYVMAQVTEYNFIYPVVAAGLTGLQAIILCMTMWLLVVHMDKLRVV